MSAAKVWVKNRFGSDLGKIEACELDPIPHVCEVEGGFDV
jgi:hypothetical protein